MSRLLLSNLVTVTAESVDSEAFERLGEHLEQRGWLSGQSGRVVIAVDVEWHPELVRTTAEAMKRFVIDRWPGVQADIVTAEPGLSNDAGLPAQDAWTVTSPVAPAGVALPHVFMTPVWLMTVAGAGPEPAARISSVFRAQARMLAGSGARLSAALVYEAHRLCRSDLSIACGSVTSPKGTPSHWWVASPDDVAVECAVARAAGAEPARLPNFRYLLRHEVNAALRTQAVYALPRLHASLAPQWRSIAARTVTLVSEAPAHIAVAVSLARTITQRVMRFAKRRLNRYRPSSMRTA